MLRINVIPNSAAAKAYYRSSDYYLDGQEQPAFWHGKAADMLGLSGEVRMDDFFALCDNKHPETGEQLTKKTLDNRRVGYDFTFSVPKSVSVAYTLGGDERLADAFRNAVSRTMAEVELGMEARVRKGGANANRTVGNLAWCDFLHTTSRPIDCQPDPHLHLHATAFNVVHDGVEGQWKAGEFAATKADAPYYQAVFRARLANEVQALGYGVRRTKDDFEIEGVPDRAVSEFSRRTKQIDALADKLGVKKPETKARLGATSREKKSKGLTWDDLLTLWRDRLSERELMAIEETRAKADKPLVIEPQKGRAVDYALAHLLERKSVATEREVVREALKFGIGSGVTPEGVWKELGRPGIIRRDGQVTVKAVVDEEKAIIRFAEKGRGSCRPLRGLTAGRAEAELRAGWPRVTEPVAVGEAVGVGRTPQGATATPPDLATLSRSQQAAIKHVWKSHDKLILIRGAAGTGKTTLTRAALSGINVPWVILAPTSDASRNVLRNDGFAEADTLARFLQDAEFQQTARNGLIWLDEASLAGAKDLHRLTELAAQLNSRVVLSGDRKQHKSVARGDTLALLEDKAGLPVATVDEIQRQRGEYKAAVAMLADGRTGRAFDKLTDMGWVKRAGHDALVDEYVSAVKKGESVLVVSPTHKEGGRITEAIRERLKAEGAIKDDEREFTRLVAANLTGAEMADGSRPGSPDDVAQFHRACGKMKAGGRVAVAELDDRHREAGGFAVYRSEVVRLAPGDAIRLTANGKSLDGHRLNNGSQYTVAGFDPAGNVRLNNGWLLPPDFGHWQHGYVVTSYAAQGKTVDRVLVAMGTESLPAVSKEAAYVSVSRGRKSASIYTDDPRALRDHWQVERPRPHATDLVRKPRHKLMRRLKAHVARLRLAATRAVEPVLNPLPPKEYAHER